MERATVQRIKTVMAVARASNWTRTWQCVRASFEYNARVEKLTKAVWREERLQPPTVTEIEAFWREIRVSKNKIHLMLGRDSVVRLGVRMVEAYGFFKLGEVLGRRHLVGYSV
ncbi:hypothetical protein PMAC_000707 [Pneumocystis sp. 'macacae']|nr:hypothetical protein PMAC_000707 [Pneumocystis sp. 'macacae']